MEKTTQPIKLFIGHTKLKNWVNCSNDLSEIDSQSVDHILSEFTLQMFDKETMLDVLKDYRRVVKKGGTIRITVPDYFLISDKYLKSKLKIEDANRLLFPSKQIIDFISLQKALTMAGFFAVKRIDIDRHPPIDDFGFYFNGENITLTVEAYG